MARPKHFNVVVGFGEEERKEPDKIVPVSFGGALYNPPVIEPTPLLANLEEEVWQEGYETVERNKNNREEL